MSEFHPSRRALLLAAGSAILAACSPKEARPGVDRPLVVALSPAHAPAKADALRAAIERASGLRVELRVAPSGDDALNLIEGHQADAGLVSLFDYLFSAEVFGVEPLAQVLRQGGSATYDGELVVRADGAVPDLQALKGRPVGFVGRYSITGFLLPAKLLRDAGVEMQPMWLGSHEAALEALRDGRVMAAATYKGAVEGKAAFKVLARTPPIANEPVFVQASMPAETKAALKKALLEIASKEPALLEGLAGATGLRDVDRAAYENALATVRTVGKAVEDLVPAGWARANERRRPLWSYAP